MRGRDIVAKNIIAYRRKNEMTQEKLSEKSGLSVDAISLIERKKTSARIDSLDQLAEAFEISISELTKERE